ncbi:cyclin d, putative [Ricinus communis]|uniref:Cyclin d, putative n=1 Tax=Ricinus communis TaxID=3988 RepID=B9SIG7_RICCO|nr:cyclin d, putative [Ricinus communis]
MAKFSHDPHKPSLHRLRYNPCKPLLLWHERQALEKYSSMESPALSADAFNKVEIRALRQNVAFFLAEQVRTDLGIYGDDILKVEILIVRALNWRLRSITPLCFVQYFWSLVAHPAIKSNAKEIIVQSQGDIRFTQYNPSVIAASAVLVSYYNEPACRQKLIGGNIKLDQRQLEDCTKMMTDMCKEKMIPFVERKFYLGECSKAGGNFESSSVSGDLTANRPEIEELSHRPGKEPIVDNSVDPSQIMEDLLKEAGRAKEATKRAKDLQIIHLELKWMMNVKGNLTLDPSMFPPEPEADQEVKEEKEDKEENEEKPPKRMHSFLKKFACFGKMKAN